MDAVNLTGVWLPFPTQETGPAPPPSGHGTQVGAKKPNLVLQYVLGEMRRREMERTIQARVQKHAEVSFAEAMATRYENLKIVNATYATLWSEI